MVKGNALRVLVLLATATVLSMGTGCAGTSHSLPSWVSSVGIHRGYYRAVGFGEGSRIPAAVQSARRNALLQIVESYFGEDVRYEYSRKTARGPEVQDLRVDDFFRSASSGSLFGQRVVHNEIDRAGNGYVAYVLLEVSKKDLKAAYLRYMAKKKARKKLLLAETRGAVLLETGHYRKALGYYQRMLRHSPRNNVWWIGTGAALYRLGKYREALEKTDHALLLNPRSFYGYWNRSSILLKLGRKREALQSLGIACRIHPSAACSSRFQRESGEEP